MTTSRTNKEFISHEWRRVATCSQHPPGIYYDLGSHTNWIRASVDTSFYPFEKRQPPEVSEAHIEQNIMRQCWATGRKNEVMIREKISLFHSEFGNGCCMF